MGYIITNIPTTYKIPSQRRWRVVNPLLSGLAKCSCCTTTAGICDNTDGDISPMTERETGRDDE